MSKEPTRAQLSSKLTYQARFPAFLQRLQRGIDGGGRDEEDDDDEFEDDGSGRPPIPRRPAIPQRPDEEPGSADEDDADEKPQVVVLKEGKHLSEREVENEKRKANGLSPLPEPSTSDTKKTDASTPKASSSTAPKLSNAQVSYGAALKGKNTKRKAVGEGRDDADKTEAATKGSKKKAKKPEKKLLSFDADA